MPHPPLTRPPLYRIQCIHEALQRGGKVNCTTLRATLGVGRKVILGDIRAMRDDHKLPIDYDKIKKTYYYMRPVSALPTMRVTQGELMAVFAGRQTLEQYRGLPAYPMLAAGFQSIIDSLADKVTFDPTPTMRAISFRSSGGAPKADLASFQGISQGLLEDREVTFDYRRPGQRHILQWRVRPYHLLHWENFWYVLAFEPEEKKVMTFAVPRAFNVVVTGTRFTRPTNFSVEQHLASALGVFRGDGDYPVVVHFTGAAADRVRERTWHDTEEMVDLPDGTLEYRVRLGALPEIERWILSWGAGARVVGPQQLRDRLKRAAAAFAQEYLPRHRQTKKAKVAEKE